MKYYRNLVYLFYPLLLPRNALQYILGSLFFFIFLNKFSYMKFFLGLTSFLLSYTFVYYLNDFIDYKTDIKDRNVKIKKTLYIKSPLFKNIAPKENLLLFSVSLLLIGLFVAYFVGELFLLLVMSSVFLNTLHTNRALKRISYFVILNMFTIQLIKVSLGWFAQGTNFDSVPRWIFIGIAGFYVLTYKIDRRYVGFRTVLKMDKVSILILSSIIIVSLLFSVLFYDIILPLVSSTIISLVLLVPSMLLKKNKIVKRRIILSLTYSVLVVFIISVLLIKLVPMLYELNSGLSAKIKENAEIKGFLLVINNTIYNVDVSKLPDYNLTRNDLCNVICR